MLGMTDTTVLVYTQVQGFDMERTSLHLPIECTLECLEAATSHKIMSI